MTRLEGSDRPTVVVTGGTMRIGRAISERLDADGWRVLTTSHRAEAGADIVADLSRPDGAERLFAATKAVNGGRNPEALVNNAALFVADGAMLEQVNFRAPAELMRLMAAREDGRGAVVNILDSCVLEPASVVAGAYADSKRALLAAQRTAATRFSSTLRVNAVAPGPVLAPIGAHEKAAETPLGRPTPQAVADAVAWLLTAAFTTGCVIPVDGGAAVRRA